MFSKAIFLNNYKRFFFLPVLHFIVLLFSGPFSMGMTINEALMHNGGKLSHDAFIDVAQMSFGSAFCSRFYLMVMSIVIAVALSSYMYVARNSYMMHAFPIKRSTLLFTNIITGLSMLIIPGAAVALISSFIIAAGGTSCIGFVWASFGLMVLMILFFFGLATFSTMATGNFPGGIVIYVIFNYIYVGIVTVVGLLAQPFMWGITLRFPFQGLLSPIVRMGEIVYRMSFAFYDSHKEAMPDSGIIYLVACALAGIVFFLLAWAVYRRKNVESAGSLLPMSWTRPIFRWGISFAISAFFIFFITAFRTFGYENPVSNILAIYLVCFAVFGSVSFIAVQMLIKKSIRVFNKKLFIEMAAMIAVFFVITVCLRFDIAGVTKYVPEPERIEEVSLIVSGTEFDGTNFNTVTDKEEIMDLTKLHKKILENESVLRDGTENAENYRFIMITYDVRDMGQVQRTYDIEYIKGEGIAGEIAEEVDELLNRQL